MTNTVIALKKSATPSSVPVDLANGELAINYADGKLYYKAANGTIASISGNEPNYFGTVNANNTLVVADTPGDILTIAAGKNIDIVGDAINDKLTVRLTDDVAVSGLLSVTASSGDEGGEIRLANAVTNSLLAGPVNIDIYQNQLRFFVSGGDARGAFINLAATSAGVGTDLLAGASATDTVARATAGQAFDKANAALSNVSGTWFNGTLTASQNLVADKIISTNNGNGENFKIGDDAWIGDINLANAFRIKGQQNASIGYVMFGPNDGKLLGRAGTDNLTYDGNTIWHAGNDGTGTGLDADLLDGQHGSYYGIATDVTAANRVANAAFLHANSGYAFANSIAITANLAFTHANAAFANGNTVIQTAQSAFTQANLAFIHANNAFASANAGQASGNAGQATANASYAFANSAHSIANLAFTHANAAFASSNADYAFSNSAHSIANLAFTHANNAYLQANAAASIANTKLAIAGGTITGNLSIVGSLTVSGNSYVIDGQTLRVSDPLIYLAGNNYVSDIVDIGFIGNYVNSTGQNVHTGLYREHENKEYYLFQGYDAEPINNHIGALSNNMTLAVLNADIRTSNLILGGANAIVTIGNSFSHANASFEQANSAETHANASFLQANTARVHANAAFLAANNASFDSGTRLAFQQTAAPTGWTKDLTHNNKALRIINGTVGTGGTVAFTTAFASKSVSGTVGNETATGTVGNQTATGNISTQTIANMVANTASADGNISNTTATGNISNTAADGTVGGTTLTTANMPSHRHTVYGSSTTTSSTAVGSRASTAQAFMGTNSTTGLQYHTNFPGSATQALDVTGGDGSHTHTFTGTAHTHTFTGTAHTHNFTPTAHVHTITDNVGHNHTFTGTAHTHTFTGTAHTHTFTGTAIDLAVQYVDFIIASKD
jgi:hypothetical protein